jgi:hypothetical protein
LNEPFFIKSPLSYHTAVKIGEIAMSDNQGLLERKPKQTYISLILERKKKLSFGA